MCQIARACLASESERSFKGGKRGRLGGGAVMRRKGRRQEGGEAKYGET